MFSRPPARTSVLALHRRGGSEGWVAQLRHDRIPQERYGFRLQFIAASANECPQIGPVEGGMRLDPY